jgi:nicotinate phosphoribosyltransferase
LAGKLFGIPIKGTMAHAFVSSFTGKECNSIGTLQPANGNEAPREIFPEIEKWLSKVAPILGVVEDEIRKGELVAFAAYAVAFPDSFLALVDTYHVLR